MPDTMRVRSPLFEGLDAAALADIYAHMKPRRFAAREVICREGDAGQSLFIIDRGLVQVFAGFAEGRRTVARLRRGEVLGELSLVTNEPRSATAVANVPTDVLELTRDAFASLLARYPSLLANLNTILGRRLAERNARREQRGETVALVADPNLPLVSAIIAATQSASPRSVVSLTVARNAGRRNGDSSSVEACLAALDDLVARHGVVLVSVAPEQSDLTLLLEHMDRVVVLATPGDAPPVSAALGLAAGRCELVLLEHSRCFRRGHCEGMPVVRTMPEDSAADIAWLGRHISRTKLGLALGAGGAKGYAHVAAIEVLHRAGYTVDYVSGSSIGAMVGAWLALGMSPGEVEATMRRAFSPENVNAIFKLSVTGLSSGLESHTRVCRETTGDRTFEDLVFPLVVMTVDLVTRRPAPINDGPLWEALLASTALAGMFPPYQRGDQRLVDGLALVPVPSDAVRAAGADVVMSVNLISPDTLEAWPGQPAPEPKSKRFQNRMLDTLLEVMDLSQMESSVRHAARADVVITPRFGPGSWRDFDLAEEYMAAGRAATEAQLAALAQLARPQNHSSPTANESRAELAVI